MIIIRSVFIVTLLALLFPIVSKAQDIQKEITFVDHKFIPFYNLKKLNKTSIFQGNKQKKNYFEGWYFKMVSENDSSIISIIPGISISEDGLEQHAFIQMIDGVSATTHYFTFPIEEFSFSKKNFAISIGENYFSKDLLKVNLQNDSTHINGEIKMENLTSYSTGRIFNHSIMGWYRFVPKMECYHGVVSLNHSLNGLLSVNEKTHNFTNGKGYIEKDWGSSMPSTWIWLQSNNFKAKNSSFMLSVANVPWRNKSFNGFLGFYYLDTKVHRFATYKSTKLEVQILDENTLKISIYNRKYTFIIDAHRNSMGILKAPSSGSMDRRIPESVDAKMKITVFNNKGIEIHQDSTSISGMEMVDNFWQLAGKIK